MTKMRWIHLALLLCVVRPEDALGATCTTTTANLTVATIQAAINAATNGAVICLPAGTATWSGSVGGSDNGLVTIPNSKGITLQGAGIGQTTITAATSGSQHYLININTHVSVSTQIRGITFQGGTGGDNGRRFIVIHGNATNAKFRIDHNEFYSVGGAVQVTVREAQFGLIDHNYFEAGNACEAVHIYGDGSSDWTTVVTPGSAEAVYVEDNYFKQPNTSGDYAASALQSYDGARTVMRFNTIERMQIDQHGTAGMVGARWWEIYGNIFYSGPSPVADWFSFMDIRGGTGVIYSNTRTGSSIGGGNVVQFREEDSSSYPAQYQVGRGQNQTAEPAYYWNNSSDFRVQFETPTRVQQGRDVITSGATRPGYTAYTYPHPLASALSVQPPSAPTSLRILPP